MNRHTGNPLYSRTLLFQVLWSVCCIPSRARTMTSRQWVIERENLDIYDPLNVDEDWNSWNQHNQVSNYLLFYTPNTFCGAPAWFLGFSALFFQLSNILSLYCDSFSPGWSDLISTSSFSRYALYSAFRMNMYVSRVDISMMVICYVNGIVECDRRR